MTEPLAIVGVGLASSVGSSAEATVAALRAGVARFAEVPGTSLPGRGGAPSAPAVAARSPLHRDEEGASRSLLLAALADAAGWAPAATWEAHAGRWAGLPADRVGGLPLATQHDADGLVHTPVLARLAGLAGQADALPAPHGLAAVDVVASSAALGHYAARGRLKSGAAPSGFVPGDAAAVLVVETEAAARAAGRPVLATVGAWGQGSETVPLGGAEPSDAAGLTDALARAFPDGSAPPDLVVADLNGERARAHEWGLAAPRALPPWEGQLPVWTPADGAGDVGVATGGLLVACAALALAWGDAERALVVASDDAGARWALVPSTARRWPSRARCSGARRATSPARRGACSRGPRAARPGSSTGRST